MSETERAADRRLEPEDVQKAGAAAMSILDTAVRWHEEMLRFCGLRMTRYFELSSRLWECKSPSDLLRLQAGFLQRMLADYREESDLVCRQLLKAQNDVARDASSSSALSSYEAAILHAQRDAAKIIDLAKDQAARIVEEAATRTSGEDPARREKRNKSATL
jgi:hypothetical protein